MKKIIVAGAGHGGLAAAALLAAQGYDVTVLEAKKRAEMGHDWHDVMNRDTLETLLTDPPAEDPFIPHTNTGFVSPSKQTELAEPYRRSETAGYIDRKVLLRLLIENAERAGAKLRFGVRAVSAACDCEKVTGVRVFERGRIREYAGDLVIDSAGIDSPVRRTLPGSFGVPNEIRPEETFYTWRGYFENPENTLTEPAIRVFFYHNGRPGMDWVNTKEGYVDVLVGGFGPIDQSDVDRAVADFRADYPFMGNRIRGGSFVKIPLRRTLPVIVANGYAAVGDCAAMTGPLSGSGIDLSMRAGRILADTVSAAGDAPLTAQVLWKYQYDYFKACGNGQISYDILKGVLNRLTAQDVNFLMESKILTLKEISSAGIQKYNAREIAEKLNILKKPRIVPGLARALRHLSQIDAVCAKLPETYDKKKIAAWAKTYEAL